MSSDDQHFLDIITSIPNGVLRYSVEITTSLERNFDQAALAVREHLSSATWLPTSARPAPPPVPLPPVRYLSHERYVGGGFLWHSYARSVEWMLDHRAITAAVMAFLGTGGWLLWERRRSFVRKRRARRGTNGVRKEVVVVAGTLTSEMTRSVVLNLERRGFIVYVVVNSTVEDEMVRSEGKMDILPLRLNITDTFQIERTLADFTLIINRPSTSFPNDLLTLAGILLIPDLTYPSGPVETLAPSLWSDVLNVKILNTIATTQAFLPIIRQFHSRILIFTPTVISSLALPFHAVESAVVGALEGFTSSLRGEMATVGVPVIHLKLGTFDTSRVLGSRQQLQRRGEGEVMDWPSEARSAYAQNYLSQGAANTSHGWGLAGLGKRGQDTVIGSSLRELHIAVFDALEQRNPTQVCRVGRGSRVYGLVGAWLPSGVLGYMMGYKRFDLGGKEEPKHEMEQEAGLGRGVCVGESVQWERIERDE